MNEYGLKRILTNVRMCECANVRMLCYHVFVYLVEMSKVFLYYKTKLLQYFYIVKTLTYLMLYFYLSEL
jgi:hypothetical protein